MTKPADTAAPSGLVAVEPAHDFGSLLKGNRIGHDFTLRNTSEEAITIARVLPSCGCTVVEFDESIPPGGEGTLHVELDTMSLSGPGESKVGVFVEGNPEPLVLNLSYDVDTQLLADPGYARWIYVQHEVEGTIPQTLYSRDGAEFEVVSVESPMPAIEVEFREATAEERVEDASGSQWRILPKLTADAPVGPIEGHLVVHTTHPEQKAVPIPVSGFVRPTLFVEPPEGRIGTIRRARPREAVFQVRNFATDPIALTGAETDLEGVSAEIVPVEEGRRYRVVVRFDPEAVQEGPFSGTLELTTDSEAVPKLAVDLSGKVVGSAGEQSD